MDSQQGIEPKVTPSSIVEDTNLKSNNESVETYDEITYHFIDTIALIQDIQFEHPRMKKMKMKILMKI